MKINFLKRVLSIGLSAVLFASVTAVSVFATDEKIASDAKYVYGKVNLPYADFYYGELNSVEEDATLNLDAEDKAKSLREEGVLDAVSSATTSKWKSYPTTYTAEHENGDGTLTQMKDSAEKLKVDLSDSLVMQNNTTYGHYEFDIEDENLPERTEMDGVIIEAVDENGIVSKYATLHSDNLWFKTGHIAFAVKEGFIVHKANEIKYKHFADIQGKTITKVTYIVRNGADVEYTTDMYCKYILDSDQGFTANNNTTYADGASIEFTANVPDDSKYAVSSVTFGKTTLEAGVDYTYEDNKFTVKDTENTGVGTYTLTYSDSKYIDTVSTATFNSSLSAEQIKIEGNKIVIDEKAEVKIADYVANITDITVDGSKLASVAGVINADGSVNFDASYTRKGNTTVFFPENKDYAISVVSAGYPEVSGIVTKSEKEPEVQPTDPSSSQTTTTVQPTTTVKKVTKSANTIKVTAKTKKIKVKTLKSKKAVVKLITVKKAQGTVTYTKVAKGSSNKLTINKKTGKITVKKGTKKGTYKIKVKVKAAGNSKYKSATKTITVTIKVVK